MYLPADSMDVNAWWVLPARLNSGQQSKTIFKQTACLLISAFRWWWQTLFPMNFRNCSVQKSKLWMWVWSWLRPSGASTTESPWPICSATSLWMTETFTHFPFFTIHIRRTKNYWQFTSSSSFICRLFAFLLNVFTDSVCMYCMLQMKQLKQLYSSSMLHGGTVQTIPNVSLQFYMHACIMCIIPIFGK